MAQLWNDTCWGCYGWLNDDRDHCDLRVTEQQDLMVFWVQGLDRPRLVVSQVESEDVLLAIG